MELIVLNLGKSSAPTPSDPERDVDVCPTCVPFVALVRREPKGNHLRGEFPYVETNLYALLLNTKMLSWIVLGNTQLL